MGDRGSEIISPALKVLAALSREVSVSLGFILRYDSGCLSSLEHRPSLPQMVIQQCGIVLSVQRRILGGLIEMRTERERCDEIRFRSPGQWWATSSAKDPRGSIFFALNAPASTIGKLSLMTADELNMS